MTKTEMAMEKVAELEGRKNWWATGNSSLSREDQLKAQALGAAKETEKLKRYDDLQAKKNALTLAQRGQDLESEKNLAAMVNAKAIQDAKDRTALRVADIRASGISTGKKDPSVLSANERTQAILKMQENGSVIGKPMSIEDAARQVDKINNISQVSRNADGTPSTTTQQVQTPAQQVVQQVTTTPTTATEVTSDLIAKPPAAISTPKGTAPTALTDKQWQQYADAKSPGMKFEGNQPGMVGDQIARFKRADGSAFFANTGAAKMQLGDALTQAPATTPPLDNTPGSVPRATMPDATNRSAMNTKVPKPQSPSAFEPVSSDATGLNRAGWNALIPKGFVNTNWTDASMAAGMTRDTGEEPSIPRPDNYDKAKALSDSLMQDLPVYTGTRPEIAIPAPETSKTQDLLNWFVNAAVKHAKPLKEDPSNLLSWLKDRKKHYTASASR